MKISALIPVKGFANAKQRLSSLLGAEERGLLAEAMFRDVLGQTLAAPGLEHTFVVTGDFRVAEIAASLGSEVIVEREERGETEAVTFAFAEMKRSSIDAVLVMPGDMPLVRAADIEFVLELASKERLAPPFALLVPSHDRMGTNGLLLSPPEVIRLRFGYDSFFFHCNQALARGASLRVVENERIALDIDEPRDLERLLAADGLHGETLEKLSAIGAADRIERARLSGRL